MAVGALSHSWSERWLLPRLAALFFLSGFSALIYQVLWLRLLSLIFGVTVYAASTVVAAFMAGLALGSIAAGTVADRVHRPLVWFGVAEALVAATALASASALGLVERAFVGLAGSLPESLVLVTAARFVSSFVVLLAPTMLMGATLPLIMRSSFATRGVLGESVGLLYGANTAGAVAGALVAGFHLIGQVGIRASFLIAAAVNVLVALTAVAMGRHTSANMQRADPPSEAPVAGQPSELTPAAARAVLTAFVLSGFASLALEVIWFRILVVHLGGTVYAFVSMLSTFLAGIALGSWAIVPFMRQGRPWLSVLVVVQAATAFVTLYSLTLVAQIFSQPWIRMSHVTTLAIAPATLLMGVAFPIGMRLWAEHHARDMARRIAVFYSLNVCGAIFGSIVAGFVLLPRLGARASLVVTAAVFGGSSLWMLAHVRRRLIYRWAAAASIVGVIAWGAAELPDPFEVALSKHPKPLLWREEGVQTTVSVHRQPGGVLVMYLDGLHQANDSVDVVRVHRQIGMLPLALHPDPRHVLVIGLGGGATAGAASRHANVSVDVVELSQAVVRAAKWFRQVNYDVVEAPNVRLRVDDGRNFLLLNGGRYDVITADIIQPIHAGAGSLYSAEYFRLALAALNDGGLMLQWIGLREATPYKLIMRTFLSVFPHATLWAGGSLMVGSLKPLRISRSTFEQRLGDRSTRETLEAVGLGSFDALLGQYTAGPDEMRAVVGPGEILTDDRPLIEYFKTLPPREELLDLTSVTADVRRHVVPGPDP